MRHLSMAIGASMIAFAGMAGAQDADVGEAIYMQYCATCHGTDGGGAGPLTSIMTERPSDLRITFRHPESIRCYASSM